jgi:hypothetical protein
MAPPQTIPAAPGEPAWDITFTRWTQAMLPRVAACVRELARRFHAIGLDSEMQVLQTPRGLSTFLAVVGQRGLICIADMTLVDGMAVGQGPSGALDVRLLDACGDVVASGLATGGPGQAASGQAPALERAGTAVYVAALAHFDVLRAVARQA